MGFLSSESGEESTSQSRRCKRHRLNPWVGKIPWNRKWQSTPVFLPGRFHGQRNLADSSPWGLKALDMPRRRSAAALRKWSKEEEEMGFRELN